MKPGPSSERAVVLAPKGRDAAVAAGLIKEAGYHANVCDDLTASIQKPKRLIYLSSGLHRSGDASLQDLTWERRPWQGQQAYADSKLHDVLLAFAVARRWSDVLSNALEPGWVATKMGGPGAPDNLDQGHRTQVWLAVSNEPGALVTGQYFYHKQLRSVNPVARDGDKQDALIEACARLSGVPFLY